MRLAQSKITAQGQISVPAEIRRKLGVGPGSILEWDESNDEVVVRRVGRNTCLDVHEALFSAGKPKQKPKRQTRLSTADGIRKYMRQKYAGG